MSKKKSVFASSNDGRLFVKVQAVMSPLCALIDALPITFFGKGKTAYLDIDTAINWCREEMKHHSEEKYEKMIAVMEKAKKQEEEYQRQQLTPS